MVTVLKLFGYLLAQGYGKLAGVLALGYSVHPVAALIGLFIVVPGAMIITALFLLGLPLAIVLNYTSKSNRSHQEWLLHEFQYGDNFKAFTN